MATRTRFNHLRNRNLFISLAGVTAFSAFTAACSSDPRSTFPDDPTNGTSTAKDPNGTSGSNAAGPSGSGSSNAAPHAPEPRPVAGKNGVVAVTVKPATVIPAASNPAAGLTLDAPSKLFAIGATSPSGMQLDAAAFSTALPHALVTASGKSATFAPVFDPKNPSTKDIAYAVYRFSAPGFAKSGMPQTVRLDWQGDTPDPNIAWIALARVSEDRWEFFAGPDDDVLTVDSFAPYQTADGDVLVLVALTSNASSTLADVALGEPELRGTGLTAGGSPPSGAKQALATGASLPRAVNLRGLMPAVRNQGSLGACTGFSTAGALNYEYDKVYGPYGWNGSQTDFNQISPRWIYNQVAFGSGKSCPTDGHSLPDVADFVVASGTATEHNAPLGENSKSDYDCSTSFWADAYSDARVLRPTAATYLSTSGSSGVQTAKEQLAAGHAIVFGMHTDDDFHDYDDNDGVWNFSGTGNESGGHAVVMAGYDDDKQAFYVRNSWGYDWGDRGYIWIGYQSFIDGKMVNNLDAAYYFDVDFNLDAAERLIASMPDIQPVAHVMASDGDYNDRVTVSWTRDPAASGYEIYRDDPANLVATITSGSVVSWTDTTVTDSNQHRYYVASYAHTSGGDVTAPAGAPDMGYAAADPMTKDVTPTGGTEGAIVTLKAQVVGTNISQYEWDFGGGATPATSTLASPTVTLTTPGLHKAHVKVTGQKGTFTYDFDLTVDQPAPTFSHTYGGSTFDDARGIFVDASGGAYVAGNTNSFGTGNDDLLLMKYDAGGALQYARTWDTSAASSANGIAADSQGNAYLVGASQGLLYGKLDATGQLSFMERIGAAADSGKAITISGSDIYVVGSTGGGASDITLTKLATNGSVVWQRTLGTSANEYGESVAVSPDGQTIYVTGTTSTASRMSEVVVAKFDSAGNFGWARQWGTPRADSDSRVAAGTDGSAFVSCTTHADTLSQQDVGIFRYDAAGNLLFQRAVSGMRYNNTLNSNYGIAVDGMNRAFVVTDYVDDNGQSGNYKHILYKLDSDGKVVWGRASDNQPNQTHLQAMAMSPLGKLAFAGNAVNASTYPWHDLTLNTDFVWNNPTGTTESAFAGTAQSRTAPVTPAAGTLSTPNGVLDDNKTRIVHALACTYNPNQ